MGKVFSKDAGLTGGSIEGYYETIARYHAARAAADREHETGYNNGKSKGQAGDEDVVNNNDSEYECVTEKASRHTEDKDPVSEIIRAAGVAPKVQSEAITHLNKALHALNGKEKDTFEHAMGALAKLGIDMKVLARKTLECVKAHTRETAAIGILIILAACTPANLGGVGLTAGGIAAGKLFQIGSTFCITKSASRSAAAGIQAGIGSVVAGSAFATLTSAAMGGYGAIIVFSSVWAVPAAAVAATVIREYWQDRNRGDHTNEDGEDRDEDDAHGRKTKQE